MATSLYGTVKKVGSSQFTFDRIYSNRVSMELNAASDGVYHGRYILITYGDRYGKDVTVSSNDLINNNTSIITKPLNINSSWLQNYNIDINKYHNIYHNTVWQKIFEGDTAKYIMVAELNARAPGLTIKTQNTYSFDLKADSNSNITYYTKPKGSNTITIHDGSTGDGHASKKTFAYPLPKWNETESNDLIYQLEMSMPLQLNVANQPEYFSAGLNSSVHSSNSTPNNLNVDNNYIRWEHILQSANSAHVIGADFNFHMPAIGQIISDVYDALYGLPSDATGTRPTNSTAQTTAIGQTGNVGIIGVLARLRLSGSTYYFHGNWTAASASDFGYIENKPTLITNITRNSTTYTWSYS